MPNATDGWALSVVIPARDEAEGLGRLLPELARVLARLPGVAGGVEVVVVDDGSTDATPAVVWDCAAAAGDGLVIRLVRTPPRGQSAAMAAGIAAARGRVLAFLDADGQNDPADLPALLATLDAAPADLVQGDRSRARCDGRRRRLASWIGWLARRRLLGDPVRDTGCTLRVMRREVAVRLPLEHAGMHRFIPVLARGTGARVVEQPVGHRPRVGGRSHYAAFGRAWPGLRGCLAVRRIQRGRLAGGPAPAPVIVGPHSATAS